MALQWREENERFRFFKPNGAQKKFIDIVGAGTNHTCIFSAANSVGKTSLVVNILANIIWPEAKIGGFEGEIFKNWKFPKRVRYITDPKLVEEIGPFNSEIEKWFPRGKYEAIKAGRNFYSQYKAKDWILDVMTYDQDEHSLKVLPSEWLYLMNPQPRIYGEDQLRDLGWVGL